MVASLSFLLLIFLSACNPLSEGQEGSYKNENYNPGLVVSVPDPIPHDNTIQMNWSFEDHSEYVFLKDALEISEGVVRLKVADYRDQEKNDFIKGTFSGVVWDENHGHIRLASEEECLEKPETCRNINPGQLYELSPSWTPHWDEVVGYWKLNGNGILADGATVPSTIGNAGVAENTSGRGLSFEVGKLSQSLKFDGVNSVSLGPMDISGTTTVTYSAWIKLDPEFSSYGVILGSRRGDKNIFAVTAARQLVLEHKGVTLTTTHTLDKDKWYHVSATYAYVSATPTNSVWRLFINGVQSAQRTGYSSYSSTTGGDLMQMGNDLQMRDLKFLGNIDEAAVWKGVALSPAEIRSIYDYQSPPHLGIYTSRVMDAGNSEMIWESLTWVPTLPFMKELSGPSSVGTSPYGQIDQDLSNDLVGLWHLNETSSTVGAGTVKNSSGNEIHGTPFNTVLGKEAKLATGAVFNGSSSYINTNLDFGWARNQGGSISFWIKPGATSANQGVMGKGQAGGFGTGNWEWSVRLNNNILTFVYWDVGGATRIQLSTIVTLGVWDHFTVTYDPVNGSALYKNGKVVATGNVVTQTLQNRSTPVLFGHAYFNAGTNYYFNGSLDEVGLWQRPLDSEEVFRLYRMGANRIKNQVRTCLSEDCSDKESEVESGQGWRGSNNDASTYFSELTNKNQAGQIIRDFPTMLFNDFGILDVKGRYFQYRTIFESDDEEANCDYGLASGPTWCSPEVESIEIRPTNNLIRSHSVTGKKGGNFDTLKSFEVTPGPEGCLEGPLFNLGIGSSTAIVWYWWNGSEWKVADGSGAQANSPEEINLNVILISPKIDNQEVFVKAHLRVKADSKCSLENIRLSGEG